MRSALTGQSWGVGTGGLVVSQRHDVTEGQHCSAGKKLRGSIAGTHPLCAVVEAFVVQEKTS